MSIEHDGARRRFRARLEEGEAFLSYERPRPGVLDLQHTIVPAAAQGRGVGDSLVRAAVGHARESGSRIIPTCPFVEHWLSEHPEEADLVERR
jgi:uncharacterized protein